MNIFVLGYDPATAARYHADKHVVKMITETCQMLSTCLREKGDDNELLYERTHTNHPCNVWLRESDGNFAWLTQLLASLIDQYDRRFGLPNKFVRAREILEYCQEKVVHDEAMTPFRLCMPDEYKVEGNPVASYRNYYIGEKAGFATWRNDAPDWWEMAILKHQWERA